jgi:hypothetical protein
MVENAKKSPLKRFWEFLKEDSWPSLIVSLIIAFIIIKFVFFPLLTFFTGSALPLVIVESCSMYHSTDFSGIFQKQAQCLDGSICPESKLYGGFNISLADTSSWGFGNGINKGDIIFVIGPKNVKVSDVIIFNAGQSAPIIHRVVSINPDGTYTTKGDNNAGLLDVEKKIEPNQLLGKAVFRIPYLGWAKLIFVDWMKPIGQRGLCS